MDLIDRIRSQSNNPAAIPQDDDPEVPEYDGNMYVEGLGGVTDLRDQFDLGPIDNEDDENAPEVTVIRDLRDDPNFDTGPDPETDLSNDTSWVDETIETGTGNDPEDDDDEIDPEARKVELMKLTRDELTTLADEYGVEGVVAMPNKEVIADAIIEAEMEDDTV